MDLFYRQFASMFLNIFVFHCIVARTYTAFLRRDHACVVDLYKDRNTFFMYRFYNLFQARDLRIIPETELVTGQSSLRVDACRLLNDQAATAFCHGAIVIDAFLCCHTVIAVPSETYHRRYADSIFDLKSF